MNRKVAIIASSLHPVIQRHIIEWGEDIIKEVPNTQFFLGSRKKEVPFATNYKLNSGLYNFPQKLRLICCFLIYVITGRAINRFKNVL